MRQFKLAGLQDERRAGQTLVGLLVCCFIMIALYFMFLVPHTDSKGQIHQSMPKQSEDRGECVALWSNINQINSLVTMYKGEHDDKAPASLDDLKQYGSNFPPEMWVDPVTKDPLKYDPQTGRVSGDAPMCQDAKP